MNDPRTGSFVHRPPTPVSTAKRISGAVVVAAAALLVCAGVARGAETDPSSSRHESRDRWILTVCPMEPGAPCVERFSFTSATACALDAASEATFKWPKGTRLTCMKRMPAR
ncbi:hypothetical protein [Nitrobacter sp.]|uniref:hypothetical protein n=1 Tax=Nitrobacter sp. TaxID=29420 RepID=UPI0029CAB84C|nr:hypothetical protein [Nitrobacter sp.]